MARYAGRGVHGKTVEVIAKRILRGTWQAGQTLDLEAMQQEFAVSLTALREALKVLAAKGMVDARQKRGTFVRPRADWNLLDGDVLRWQFDSGADTSMLDQLQEVRGIVEPAAARLAAQRRTGEDLEALERALDAMRSAGDDAQAQVAADLAYHRALLDATHNELLQRMEMVLETGLAERDRLVHGTPGHYEDPVPSHRAVFEAIRDQDAELAERSMHVLLDQAVRDVARLRQDPTAGQ
jgi:GntR family galactonate operon transcriptional repressor